MGRERGSVNTASDEHREEPKTKGRALAAAEHSKEIPTGACAEVLRCSSSCSAVYVSIVAPNYQFWKQAEGNN